MQVLSGAQDYIDEAATLRAAATGDEQAFQQIYERHRQAVFAFAYRLLSERATAEDVVQDCFLEVLRQPTAFDSRRGSLRAYLFGIARHHVFKRWRKTEAEARLEEAEELAATNGAHLSPLADLLKQETAELVQRAIASLPALQREALVLFEYEEMSLQQIAAITDAEVGSIKARLFRARENLKRELAALLNERSSRDTRASLLADETANTTK